MPRSLIVVGAGPAGMAAAIEAEACNAAVTLLDEAARPGGQIYRQSHLALTGSEWADRRELARKHRLLAAFTDLGRRIDYRPGTSVFAVFPDGEVHVARGPGTERLRADAIVLATGVREQAIPFPGWTTPGVMFAGGAQAILKAQRVLPGRRAVIAGCGPLPIVVTAQMLRAGAEVAALALLHPFGWIVRHPGRLWHGRGLLPEGLRYALTAACAVRVRLSGYVPLRALGGTQLEAVVLGRIDAEGAPIVGSDREFACDLLAVNYGFAANSELAAMAGAEMRFDPAGGGWIPAVDAYGRTSVPGLFAAGDGAGLNGALAAEAEGRIVGAAAALGADPPRRGALAAAWAQRQRYRAFQSALRTMLALPPAIWNIARDDTIVCRCEQVTRGEISAALEGGYLTPNAIKRATRAGMGWCGGRTCLSAVAALAGLHGNFAAKEMMTPRPLARPVPLAALATPIEAAS